MCSAPPCQASQNSATQGPLPDTKHQGCCVGKSVGMRREDSIASDGLWWPRFEGSPKTPLQVWQQVYVSEHRHNLVGSPPDSLCWLGPVPLCVA